MRTVVVEKVYLPVEISNRGAVGKELEHKNYKDDRESRSAFSDVVHPDASQQTGRLALFVVRDDEQLPQNAAKGDLIRPPPPRPRGKARRVEFKWSDGHREVN